jgi:tetratricopeptide (TPR) repeat protein
MGLSEHLQRSRHAAEALEVIDQFDAKSSEAPNVLALRAIILRDLGRQEEEVAILERLSASEIQSENYRIRLGHAYRNLGKIEQAVASYRAVIAQAPVDGTAWWSLANLKSTKFSDSDIAAMEQALAFPQAPDINRIRLHFALGKAFEDRKDVERSFRHYEEGNRIRNATASYDPRRYDKWVKDAETDYDKQFFDPGKDPIPASDPIFVIGIQRSGSTLVEQILDSHPNIEGTAELTAMPSILREQGDIAHRRGISFNEHFRRMSGAEARALGEKYIERTSVYRLTDKPHFTDKMPNNWIYAGAIRKVLPNAKIVDVRRHPLDCCFSNWKQLYGSGLEHSYSMENMARYYADYVRLMQVMDKLQPGKIHRVTYEHLVEDTEGEVRRLLDYLGLPFDEACLNFHSNERSVRTISAEQVRQPINRRGIGQWKPYEQWLGPMKDALGSALTDWDK